MQVVITETLSHIQTYPNPLQYVFFYPGPFQGPSSSSGPKIIVLITLLGELQGGRKGRGWHLFSHLRKNTLRLHAQDNGHVVKWQGSSDKA